MTTLDAFLVAGIFVGGIVLVCALGLGALQWAKWHDARHQKDGGNNTPAASL